MTPEEKKIYMREWRKKNAEKLKVQNRERNRRYRERNKEKIAKRAKVWREENKEQYEAAKRAHYERNKEKYNARSVQYWKDRPAEKAAHCAKRRARKKQAIPGWAKLEVIKELYRQAQATSMTVDHIVPLSSKLVCGLHCEDNLQLLTLEENSSKHNTHWPDMP